jgi:hypothetical protein
MKGDVANNIHYLEDSQTLLYPVGNNIVIYNAALKTQKVIPGRSGHRVVRDLRPMPLQRWRREDC